MKLFEAERLRHRLAVSGDLREFKKTYEFKEELKNLNSASFWNMKTKKDQKDLIKSPIYKDKIRIISNFLKMKSGKLLDIGFGLGYLEKRLTKYLRLSLFGIDISELAVNGAQKTLRGEYGVAGIFKVPYKSSFFDIVLILDVIEHIQTNKTLKAYGEIVRVMKKNGILVVSIPLNEGLEEMIKRGKNPNSHMRNYTPAILKGELKLFGFKIVKEYYLYAFQNNYWLKSFFLRLLPFETKKPNLMIVFARK